nr:hypothetical protein [Tanacetum cinerariifolium]
MRKEIIHKLRNKIFSCMDRTRGFFFKPDPGGPLKRKWEKLQLDSFMWNIIVLKRRRDLVKPTNMRIGIVKENKEKDKIGSKPDKNGKRGEAEKILKQLQLKEEEKPKKTKKEWSKTHTRSKSYASLKK